MEDKVEDKEMLMGVDVNWQTVDLDKMPDMFLVPLAVSIASEFSNTMTIPAKKLIQMADRLEKFHEHSSEFLKQIAATEMAEKLEKKKVLMVAILRAFAQIKELALLAMAANGAEVPEWLMKVDVSPEKWQIKEVKSE